jgi:hypothetical protein
MDHAYRHPDAEDVESICEERGRFVAQAVSRWLSTAAARVRVRAACGVCGGQSGTGAGFLLLLVPRNFSRAER